MPNFKVRLQVVCTFIMESKLKKKTMVCGISTDLCGRKSVGPKFRGPCADLVHQHQAMWLGGIWCASLDIDFPTREARYPDRMISHILQ